MSIFDHYIPESESKARQGCFSLIAWVGASAILIPLVYNIFTELEHSVFFVIGLLLLVGGFIFQLRIKLAERKGYRTKARIVDFEPDENSIIDGEETKEFAVVKFLDEKGILRSCPVAQSETIGTYSRGNELKIIKFGDDITFYDGPTYTYVLIMVLGAVITLADIFILN